MRAMQCCVTGCAGMGCLIHSCPSSNWQQAATARRQGHAAATLAAWAVVK